MITLHKESACQAGVEDSNPRSKRFLREGNGNSLLYLAWEGQRSLADYSPWGCEKIRYDFVTKQQRQQFTLTPCNTSAEEEANLFSTPE